VSGTPANAPNWHILPFHIYHWFCYRYGLEIERVLGVRKRWHSFLVGLWIYPVSTLSTYVAWVLREKDLEQRAYNFDLWRTLYCRELLLSNNIVVKIRRPAGS
jgi:hypothetical protein